MTDALLPCPFCGEAPTLREDPDGNTLILCRSSVCTMHVSSGWRNPDTTAIDAWNTRAPAAAKEAGP